VVRSQLALASCSHQTLLMLLMVVVMMRWNTGRRRRRHLVTQDWGLRQLMLPERRPRKLRRSSYPNRSLRQNLPDGHGRRRRWQSDGGDYAVGKCWVPVGQVDHPQRLRVMLNDMMRTQTREVRQLLVCHPAEHRQRRLTRLQRRRRRRDLCDERLRHVEAWWLLRRRRLGGRGAASVLVDLNDEAHVSLRRRFLRPSVESDTNWS
jgi:hypothetical protein